MAVPFQIFLRPPVLNYIDSGFDTNNRNIYGSDDWHAFS